MLADLWAYANAIGFVWWVLFWAVEGVMGVLRMFREFSRWWFVGAALVFLILAPFLAWRDMREQRDALLKTGPELRMGFRSHHRSDGYIDVFVRNDGDEMSVVESFYVCGTPRWTLEPHDTDLQFIRPEHLLTWEEDQQEQHRTLMRAMYVSDPGLRLFCRDQLSVTKLSVDVLSGQLAIGPGEVSEFRLNDVPRTWFVHQALFSNPIDTVCPLQLNADNASAVLAIPCSVTSND